MMTDTVLSHMGVTSIESRAKAYETLAFTATTPTDYVHKLLRMSDTVEATHLVLTVRDERVLDLSGITFTIEIGEQRVLTLDLGLCAKLNTPDTVAFDNVTTGVIIPLPSKYTVAALPLTGLFRHDVCFRVENTDSNIIHVAARVEAVYLTCESRLKMETDLHETLIQQSSSLYLSYDVARCDMEFRPRLHNMCKGYFLEGNIAELTNVRLMINRNTTWDYTAIDIRMNAVKLHDTLLYIPFDDCVDFKDLSMSSFASAMRHSRDDAVELRCTFRTPQTKLILHTFEANVLRVTDGTGALCFPDSSSHLRVRNPWN